MYQRLNRVGTSATRNQLTISVVMETRKQSFNLDYHNIFKAVMITASAVRGTDVLVIEVATYIENILLVK